MTWESSLPRPVIPARAHQGPEVGRRALAEHRAGFIDAVHAERRDLVSIQVLVIGNGMESLAKALVGEHASEVEQHRAHLRSRADTDDLAGACGPVWA
jgi:hypothetical protein